MQNEKKKIKEKGRCLKASKLELNRTSHVLKFMACLSALVEHGQSLRLYQCHFSTNMEKLGKSEMKGVIGHKEFAFALIIVTASVS